MVAVKKMHLSNYSATLLQGVGGGDCSATLLLGGRERVMAAKKLQLTNCSATVILGGG